MSTLAVHFESIEKGNYDPYREPLQVKFDSSDRQLKNFSIRYIDGFTKGLIGHLIVAIVDQLASEQHLNVLDMSMLQQQAAGPVTDIIQTDLREFRTTSWTPRTWLPC